VSLGKLLSGYGCPCGHAERLCGSSRGDNHTAEDGSVLLLRKKEANPHPGHLSLLKWGGSGPSWPSLAACGAQFWSWCTWFCQRFGARGNSFKEKNL